ncbi:MAG: hypothetical protein EZS28_024815 [Streblomastix strix]|uniref:Protein kinase domain-containing protein n=1 Tax=Streblomastix strix TaxID=222440 RepID=A0A5J4VAX5_9EUKA|nr:MAG: hypothetical protein EZS28_024815 [Streblomastix strix]
MDYEDALRRDGLVPLRPLGSGSFGCVYLAFHSEYGIIAAKLIHKDKYYETEWDSAKKKNRIVRNPANGTLNIIAKQPNIILPSYTLRALMKQTLEGLRVFHAAGLIHRDIKCDNILLHNPPGSGFVYAKISDFGFAERKNQKNELSQFKGTLPYMGPEMFQQTVKATQKVDIYALGITFYHLLTHQYPIYEKNIKEHQKKMAELKNIS